MYIFSRDFLVIWLFTLFAAFVSGLRFNQHLQNIIIEYISNKLGFEFNSIGLFWLFIGIIYFIFFILIMSDCFSFSNIVNYIKKEASLFG